MTPSHSLTTLFLTSFFLLAAPAVASDAPSIDQAIAVPIPEFRLREMSKYEIPELAGAQVATGSQLIEGALPRPVADYYARMGNVTERVTLFETGLASVTMKGNGTTISKKLILPPDALAAYRRHLAPELLEGVPEDLSTTSFHDDEAFLRIYSSQGIAVERRFDPSQALPARLERQRIVMQDLLRVISEDRELSNPITDYKPQLGDILIADDQTAFEITRLIKDGDMVELRGTRQPVRMYVRAVDLAKHFFRARRPRVD